GEQAFFHAAEKHQRELQAFGGVEGHERDSCIFVVSIGIADERGMVQKLVEGFAAVFGIHGCIGQFVQVLNAGVGFGRVFIFQQFSVAGSVNEELENVGGGGGRGVGFGGRDGSWGIVRDRYFCRSFFG